MTLEIQAASTSKIPVYSPNQIFAGSIMGGPIAVLYFLHKNYQSLNNPAAAKKTLLWGSVLSLLFLGATPFLPDDFPDLVMPIVYSWLAQKIAKMTQLSKSDIASSPQYRFQSNGNVFGISTLTFLGTFVLLIAYLYILASLGLLGPLPSLDP